MQKYDSYKDSGIEWIGEIPEHWQIKRLKYIKSEEKNAFVDGPFGSNLKSEHFIENGDVYVIDSGYVTSGKFEFHRKFKTVSQEHFETVKRSECKADDLIIAKIGANFGMSGVLPCLDKRSLISGNSLKLTINTSKYDLRFSHIQLLNLKRFGEIDLLVKGSAQPALSMSAMNDLPFIMPDNIEEQTAIANYLDKKTAQIDDLISKKERLIELLNEERTAMINHAVTKGLAPQGPTKDSGIEWLGEIPAHWEVKRLKYLVKTPLKYGANEPALEENINDPRYIRITDFSLNGNLKFNTFKSLAMEKAKDFLLVDGDILFARSGATVGKTFFFKDFKGIACFAGYLIKATCNTDVIMPEFLYSFTNSSGYENWKQSIFQQATIQNIGADKYNQLKLAVPPIREQFEIVNFIKSEESRFLKRSEIIKRKIKLLNEYKSSLISEVVTGKVNILNEKVS